MGFRNKKQAKEPEEKTIEINAQMHGTLSFKDPVNLQINGNFNGTLDTRGSLTIGKSANVEAHISGESIIVAGTVRGDVIAKQMLVLLPTASLYGNISTPSLNIVEGAFFQGMCQMHEEQPESAQDLPGEGALDIEEVARYLEIDIDAIQELANSGKIPAIKSGENWRFERDQIDNWASSGRIK